MTVDRINIPNVPPAGKPQRPSAPAPAGRDFAGVLAGRLRDAQPAAPGDVSFSKHALERLGRRGIQVEPGQAQRLGAAVDAAAQKGSRSSLVLVDDLAFVVGVPARTVITAIDQQSMKEKVFTNIDSTVIA